MIIRNNWITNVLQRKYKCTKSIATPTDSGLSSGEHRFSKSAIGNITNDFVLNPQEPSVNPAEGFEDC
jgi:hypothetical protein